MTMSTVKVGLNKFSMSLREFSLQRIVYATEKVRWNLCSEVRVNKFHVAGYVAEKSNADFYFFTVECNKSNTTQQLVKLFRV